MESISEMAAMTQPPRAQHTPNRPPIAPQRSTPGDTGDVDPGVKDSRRVETHPDSHQLFVGNIPHDVNGDELFEFFTTYGNVVDLRINTRNAGEKIPNFGFVVFDNSEEVKSILERPILFRGVNLNVQEKLPIALLRQQTRGRWNDRRNMRRNDQGSGHPQGDTGDVNPGVKDSRRVQTHPDSHQLFVGKLPQDVDGNELLEFFTTYGNVVEVRINTRNVGGKIPNFGFVVFDNSEDVQSILDEASERPLLFRDDVTLNVEEKKPMVLRRRQTRGLGDNPNMRRNNQGSGHPQGDTGDVDPGFKDSRMVETHPDSHQLFVGKLPHDVDGNELMEFFTTYGNVVELRINTRNVGGKIPNFGFVVFDNPEDVQSILDEASERPLLFRGEVTLNVEEKKPIVLRRRQTRGRGDNPNMRRNNQGSGHPQGDTGDVDPGVKDSRKVQTHPDSHQLFVGKLPQDVDEDELLEFFTTYGNAVEVRINTRNVGGKIPNFGFVVFDNSEDVQSILDEASERPLLFRGEVTLNVEEKKPMAPRRRQTRGRGDNPNMRRNY